MSQAHRIKQIMKNLTHQKQKILFEFILIQFFKTRLLVKTCFYLFQMPVFLICLNTTIWWETCNQAVAPRITRLTCMPLVVMTTDLMFRKILSFYGLTNFMLKWIWCGSEGSYDDFCMWDI